MLSFKIYTATEDELGGLLTNKAVYVSQDRNEFYQSREQLREIIDNRLYDYQGLRVYLKKQSIDVMDTRFYAHIISHNLDGDGIDWVIDEYEVDLLDKHEHIQKVFEETLNNGSFENFMNDWHDEVATFENRVYPIIEKYGRIPFIKELHERGYKNIFWHMISYGTLDEHCTHHKTPFNYTENYHELDDFETSRYDIDGVRISIFSGQGDSFAEVHTEEMLTF